MNQVLIPHQDDFFQNSKCTHDKMKEAEKLECQRSGCASPGRMDSDRFPSNSTTGANLAFSVVSPSNGNATEGPALLQSEQDTHASVDQWFQILVSEYDKNQLRSLTDLSPSMSFHVAAQTAAT
jgi:hypothetical protein